MIKIMTVCGMGLGSSLLAKMTAERVLKNHGISDKSFYIDTCDIGSARQSDIDIYLTTKEFAEDMKSWDGEIVVVKNLFDEQEMMEQLIPVYLEVAQ